MGRFLRLSLLLGVVQLIVGAAVMVGLFRQVDLRFSALLSLILIPPFQAAVFLWVTRDPATRTASSVHEVFRSRFAVTLYFTDLVVLTFVLVWLPHLARIAFGLHALTAALLFLSVVRPSPRGRRWVVLLTAAGLALYGVAGFWNWLALLPGLLGNSAKVLRWALVYGVLFCTALIVLLATAAAFRSRSPAAAGWIEVSIALLLVSAAVVVSNVFFHPWLREPWKTLQMILAWTSVTAMMLSTIAMDCGAGGSDEA